MRSPAFRFDPRLDSMKIMGVKMIEAMMNLSVARRTGVRVVSTARAATKENPQMTATAMAEIVPCHSLASDRFASRY